jgi:hypothetical protein
MNYPEWTASLEYILASRYGWGYREAYTTSEYIANKHYGGKRELWNTVSDPYKAAKMIDIYATGPRKEQS